MRKGEIRKRLGVGGLGAESWVSTGIFKALIVQEGEKRDRGSRMFMR